MLRDTILAVELMGAEVTQANSSLKSHLPDFVLSTAKESAVRVKITVSPSLFTRENEAASEEARSIDSEMLNAEPSEAGIATDLAAFYTENRRFFTTGERISVISFTGADLMYNSPSKE